MDAEKSRVLIHPNAEAGFLKLDESVKGRIRKKLRQLEGSLPSRHLGHGLPYFVEEAGQYRIAFEVDSERKMKIVHFIGSHKEYEKWLKS
ncbi:MAG: hypothetical protein V1787_03035 [Candidatus Micrarchaeota archaeon]